MIAGTGTGACRPVSGGACRIFAHSGQDLSGRCLPLFVALAGAGRDWQRRDAQQIAPPDAHACCQQSALPDSTNRILPAAPLLRLAFVLTPADHIKSRDPSPLRRIDCGCLQPGPGCDSGRPPISSSQDRPDVRHPYQCPGLQHDAVREPHLSFRSTALRRASARYSRRLMSCQRPAPPHRSTPSTSASVSAKLLRVRAPSQPDRQALQRMEQAWDATCNLQGLVYARSLKPARIANALWHQEAASGANSVCSEPSKRSRVASECRA